MLLCLALNFGLSFDPFVGRGRGEGGTVLQISIYMHAAFR